jgi:hypothetical protein
MNDDFNSLDRLISDILGTTNFIGRFLFNRNSILLAAGISLLLVVLVWAF